MLPMIQETHTYQCTNCGSINIVRNGRNKCGNRQYHCKDCGAYRVLKPKTGYSQERKETILKACKERCSLRGIQRIFGIAPKTVARWIKAHALSLPALSETLLPAQNHDVLELDELCGLLSAKDSKNDGFGLPCVGELAKLCLSILGAATPAVVDNCGRRFQLSMLLALV